MRKMMKRWPLLVLLLGAAAVLVPAQAQIPGPPDNGSNQLHAVVSGGMGTIKDVAQATPYYEPHVGMPGPYVPEDGPMAQGSQLLPGRGSAIVQPTGGSFITPKQQADREIRQLIRKLG